MHHFISNLRRRWKNRTSNRWHIQFIRTKRTVALSNDFNAALQTAQCLAGRLGHDGVEPAILFRGPDAEKAVIVYPIVLLREGQVTCHGEFE